MVLFRLAAIRGDFKFGFVGELKIEIVGADVLDGPFRIPRKTLLGVRNLRGAEDVAPYIEQLLTAR